MGRVIAMVGTAINTRTQVNSEPDDVEIWSCCGAFYFVDRTNRHFELHHLDDLPAGYGKLWLKYSHWLQRADFPVYMREKFKLYPSSVEFPKDEILASFRPYFRSTMAWMVALALHEGVDEIKLFGIDMVHEEEHAYQRPNMEYLLGVAEGRGVRITMPEVCPLLKGPLYAFGSDTDRLVHTLEARGLELHRMFTQSDQTTMTIRARQTEIDRIVAQLKGVTDKDALEKIANGTSIVMWGPNGRTDGSAQIAQEASVQ